MATKAGIKAAVQEKMTGSGSKLTWDRHEEIFIDEDDSIVENFYHIPVDDTGIIQSFDSVTTISSARVTKQGSRINISCNVTALVNTVNLIEIIGSEYQIAEATSGNFNIGYHTQCSMLDGSSKTVYLSRYQDDDTRILSTEAILAGTLVRVNISYNTFE